MRPGLLLAAVCTALCLLASGCSSGQTPARAAAEAKPRCAFPAGWKKLATRIKAPVYCPGWLPDPLTSQLGGRWNNIDSVSPDRSYLESFVWQETGPGAAGGELHVNLRGYPGRIAIPRCTRGGKAKGTIPCFSDPRGRLRANGIVATMYTVNQDADQWHILLAWHRKGGLYTLSEHVAPPLTYSHVVRYLKHELRALVLIEPSV